MCLLLSRDSKMLSAKYYFSNAGSDSNNGSIGSPWATITKFNTLSLAAGDSVFFKGGDKFSGEMYLTHSGSLGNQIVITSYGIGKATITGFQTLSGFTNVSGNTYEATCTGCAVRVNVVRLNGADQYMGRWPDTSNGNGGYIKQNGATINTVTDSLITDTIWTGAELVTRTNNFTLDRQTVLSQIGFVYTGTGATAVPITGFGYFIQNDPRTLTLTGEWYWKNSTSKLQIYLPGGGGSNVVEIASQDTLVTITGSFLTIKNLNIEGGNTHDICFTSSVSYDSILNCNINYAGVNGIDVRFSSATVLSHCAVTDCNLRHNHNNSYSVIFPAEVDDSQVKHDSIEYSAQFAGMGLSGLASNSGIQWFGSRDSIFNNKFWKTGGVCTAQYGGDTNVYYRNHMDSSCITLADAGGIYISVHSGVRNTLVDNIITHMVGNHYGTDQPADIYASGIYLDNGANNILMQGNTLAYNSYNGWFDHFTKACIHRYNTVFANKTSQWYTQEDSPHDTARRNVYVGNQLVSFDSTSLVVTWYTAGNNDFPQTIGFADSNYYARPIRQTAIARNNGGGFTYYTFPAFQQFTGQDIHSKGSPVAIGNDNSMILYINPTFSDSTVILPDGYVDVTGLIYLPGPYVLHPFKSLLIMPLPILSQFMINFQ